MVTTKNNRKLPFPDMIRHDAGDSLADLRYKSRVLHLADWWVVLFRDLFELVVPVKLNLPSQVLKLLSEAGFDQVDGTVINSKFSLVAAASG